MILQVIQCLMGVYSLSVHLMVTQFEMGASLVLSWTWPSLLLGLLVSQLGGEDASRVARPPLGSPDTDVYLLMGGGAGGLSYYLKIVGRRDGVLRS